MREFINFDEARLPHQTGSNRSLLMGFGSKFDPFHISRRLDTCPQRPEPGRPSRSQPTSASAQREAQQKTKDTPETQVVTLFFSWKVEINAAETQYYT